MNKPTYEELEVLAKIGVGLYNDAAQRAGGRDPGVMSFYLAMENVAVRIGCDALDEWLAGVDVKDAIRKGLEREGAAVQWVRPS